jgi:cell division protein ZapA (FtsZ GTPase activity inhibitor)
MNMVDLVERLGVTGVLVFMCIMFIHKFINTDKKVEAMHRRMDNLKQQITGAMEDTKDEISELNRDLLRNFRNGGK